MPDVASFLTAMAPFIAIGFAAQMIDGALGMAFGVITLTASERPRLSGSRSISATAPGSIFLKLRGQGKRSW